MASRDDAPAGGTSLPGFDRDVSVRAIGMAALLLVAVCVAAMLLMGSMLRTLRRSASVADPPPPAMLEAREIQLPPGPRLQEDPPTDLARVRAQERYLLENYGWVDRSAGLVRIPVAKAMEILAARGLPVRQETAGGDAPDPRGGEAAPPAGAPADPQEQTGGRTP